MTEAPMHSCTDVASQEWEEPVMLRAWCYKCSISGEESWIELSRSRVNYLMRAVLTVALLTKNLVYLVGVLVRIELHCNENKRD